MDCIICAYPVDGVERHRCLTECSHQEVICSICFLRIRAIQRNFHCPTCKREIDYVICPQNKDPRKFSDFHVTTTPHPTNTTTTTVNNKVTINDDRFIYDNKGQMFFLKEYFYEKIKKLWIFSCSVCPNVTKNDFRSLRKHMMDEHNLYLCNLCNEFKQVFPSEHKVYTQSAYDSHLRFGDKDGSIGHPICEFCHKRYYDSSALFIHLTQDHFNCHLCRTQGIKFRYYSRYLDLEGHFRESHFLCEDPICLEKRYIVFSNDIDLFSHKRAYHPTLAIDHKLNLNFQYRRNDNIIDSRGARVMSAMIEQESSSSSAFNGMGGGGEGRGGMSAASEGNRKERFEGGLGGKAQNGEWQVEIQPTTFDPRDPNRNLLRDNANEQPKFEEEFPGLPGATGPSSLITNRFITVKENNNSREGSTKLKKGSGSGSGSGSSSGGMKGGSYSSTAITSSSQKEEVNEYPSLPKKLPTKSKINTGLKKPSASSSSSTSSSSSDVKNAMNYVTKMAEVEEDAPRPAVIVGSLGNFAHIKMDKRMKKKKVSQQQQHSASNNDTEDDLDEEEYPVICKPSSSQVPSRPLKKKSEEEWKTIPGTASASSSAARFASKIDWNETGMVDSSDAYTFDLAKALHDSLEEFNVHQVEKGTENSLKERVSTPVENNGTLKESKKVEENVEKVSAKPMKKAEPSKANSMKKLGGNSDITDALKSLGLGVPKKPKKSSGITVIKANTNEANKKMTVTKDSNQQSVWGDDEIDAPKPPPGLSLTSSSSLSPPRAPLTNNEESKGDNNKKKNYGGWVRIGGADREPPPQLPITQQVDSQDFPGLSSGKR
jgi:hypothetical protein